MYFTLLSKESSQYWTSCEIYLMFSWQWVWRLLSPSTSCHVACHHLQGRKVSYARKWRHRYREIREGNRAVSRPLCNDGPLASITINFWQQIQDCTDPTRNLTRNLYSIFSVQNWGITKQFMLKNERRNYSLRFLSL